MPQAEKFSNVAYIQVEESAANTLTFKKLETGIAPFEKRAWLISRIEYFFASSSTNFAADNDRLQIGISASNSFTAVDLGENAILDLYDYKRIDLGAAASGMFQTWPAVKDLSTIPGGGLLAPPNPLYLFAKGSSLPNAMTVDCRFYYTSFDLKADEFWELVEMRRMVGT